MKLSQLKKRLSDMSDEEVHDAIRQTRKSRMEKVSKHETKKGSGNKGGKKANKKGNAAQSIISSLSPEEAEELLKTLEGDNE